MKQTYDVACKGLLIGQPVEELAAWLNAETPTGIHFDVVGSADPQPLASQIINNMIARARKGWIPIYVGHSMGAMLAFYAAQALKAAGIASPLFVSIDPTCWGTNAAGYLEWAEIIPQPYRGRYFVPNNVDVWLHFYQDGYPGGGVASLAEGNAHTDLRPVHLPQENHLSIVNATLVRTAVLDAVMKAAA